MLTAEYDFMCNGLWRHVLWALELSSKQVRSLLKCVWLEVAK